MNTTVNKAVVAILGGVVTLAATAGLDLSWASDGLIQGVGTMVTAFLVWLIPNSDPVTE